MISAASTTPSPAGPEGTIAAPALMTGVVVAIDVAAGELVHEGQQLVVLELMKMEHVVTASSSGLVRSIAAAKGDVTAVGQSLLFIEPRDVEGATTATLEFSDLDVIRPDLAEVIARHELTHDAARAQAVARRHAKGGRTARQNVEDRCDQGSFIEYGGLTVAAQRRRTSDGRTFAHNPGRWLDRRFWARSTPPVSARIAALARSPPTTTRC